MTKKEKKSNFKYLAASRKIDQSIDAETKVKDFEDGDLTIVVFDRGWVFIGFAYKNGELITLRNAMNIHKWGTTEGLGQLADGPLEETILNPVRGEGIVSGKPILTISANVDKW